jgi:cytochrome c oxidase subunit 2
VRVDLYERFWMMAAGFVIASFVGAVVLSASAKGLHPPSNVETIDPRTARSDPRFTNPGVREREDGRLEVTVLALMWSFTPNEIRIPQGRDVTFRITSTDVIHGFQVVGTNVNTMVVPGYVSSVTTRFRKPGEYLIVCQEYCGIGHHVMAGKVIVEGGS